MSGLPVLATGVSRRGGPRALDPFLAWLPAGGLFSKTEMSEVLTEILRVDPAFDKERFLQQCENDIIPNVLEVGRPLSGPSLSCPASVALGCALSPGGARHTGCGLLGCSAWGRHLSCFQKPEGPHAWPLLVTHI